MIIELSPEFAALDEAGWGQYHQAVENLISAHSQGWHLLSPSRPVADALLASCHLSKTQREVFTHHVRAKASTLVGQARSAKLTLLANVDGQERRTVCANQIGVPLRIFSDLANCSPSRLITENATTDGRVIELLADMMSRELSWSAPLKLEHVHGGGGTISNCYDSACSSGRPTLCIVDSDQKFPGGPLGITAKQILALRGKEAFATVDFFIVPVREIENAIPLSIFYEVYSDNAELRTRLSALCDYAKKRRIEGVSEIDNVLCYFDMKSGLKCMDIAKIPDQYRASFVRFAQIVSSKHRTCSEFDAADAEFVHKGVAETALAQFISFLESEPHRAREIVSKVKNAPAWHWLSDLLHLVLSYGAGGARIPVGV